MVDGQRDMAEVPDVELLKGPEDLFSREAPPKRPMGAWELAALAVAALAVVGAAAAVYVLFVGRAAPPLTTAPTTPAPASVAAPPAAQPLGSDVAPIDLPPLAESDPLVRTLVKALSSHPRIAAWLATDGLIRNFTVVVANIAESRSPARHLAALRLSSPFRVVDRGGVLSIDARNYARYEGLVAAVASVEPAAAARLYATLKPSIDEAYRELGNRDEPFDRALERALVSLLETPAPSPTPRLGLGPKGIGYVLADRRLEALSPAQKQILRMGPHNARAIQSSLRQLALALGIPAERLPAPKG
jgi:hypothetical protein